MSTIQLSQDADGIATVLFDTPGESVNTMNAAFQADFAAAVTQLEARRDQLRGVILASGKSTFFAGGDLKALAAVKPSDAGHFLMRSKP